LSYQLFYEEVQIGDTIGPLDKQVTTRQLVQYAGASGDYYEIHYDKDFAAENELPGVIIHGALKNAFLAELVIQWIGGEGKLMELTCQYRGMDVPNDILRCEGTVSRKNTEDSHGVVECDLWITNGRAKKTTFGSAKVFLPTKAS
jgi:acyl dehydratase